jgi:hypothetical protein
MNATHVPLETQSNSDVDGNIFILNRLLLYFYFLLIVAKKTNSMVTPSEIYQLVRDINTKRTIPVRGFSFCIILRKILKCIKMGGRRGMLPLLDDTLLLSYWKQVRKFSVMTHIIMSIDSLNISLTNCMDNPNNSRQYCCVE